MSGIPFTEINAAALAAYPGLLFEWFPAGRIRGHEFVIGDLRGSKGESLSINVRTGAWADFASDAKGGDPISLHAAAAYGGNQAASARAIGQKFGVYMNGHASHPIEPTVPASMPKQPDTVELLPWPNELPDFAHWIHGKASGTWIYRAADGTGLCVVARYETTDERGKQFAPWIYGRRGNRTGWHCKALPAPRPLYGLDRLAAHPDAPVLVCEGEKTADAAAVLFPDYVTIAALNGAKSPAKSDWTPLAGRAVVIWPDLDQPGAAFAVAVANLVRAAGAQSARIVEIPADWPAGWDLADATPDHITPEVLREILLREPEPEIPEDGDWMASTPEFDGSQTKPQAEPTEGIVPLGYNRGIFYYLSRSLKQVVALTTSRHTKTEMMGMASVAHYWQRQQFVNEKGGIEWDAAIDDLMVKCRAVGIYDPDKLRGRGAWIDNGRAVLHVGDKLIVDGNTSSLVLTGSRYVYEADKALMGDSVAPLSTREANTLVKICTSLRWEKQINGVLFAGFLAVAPICGGLAWRPSIWITGKSGSGKSYVYDNILGPALGGMALRVQSKTTEAGIRQRLCADARPVIFDEAEREDAAAAARIQGVLDLMRQSASESGGEIIKGSQNQSGAKAFKIRSSFAFCSINVGIEHQADESRTTILALLAGNPNNAAAESRAFEELNALVTATITPEFSAGLLARSVKLLPTIRINAETFARAVALHLGSRRAGDQLGALLAGAYSLHSEREITMEEATAYVSRLGWAAEAAQQDNESNEVRLLSRLTQHRVRFSIPNKGAAEATVGRLIESAFGRDPLVAADTAESELNQIGIRTEPGGIFVSNTHPAIARILDGTPWATGWHRALRGVPGAEPAKPMKFGLGHLARATFIPLTTLDGEAAG